MKSTVPIDMSPPAYSAPDRRAAPRRATEKPRVLVVDDSRLQRRILAKTLRNWGFEVDEAQSGTDGLAIATDRCPNLIISDWMMPEMNGLEFCAAIRQREDLPYVYFVLLTSKGEKDDIARGLEAGADDFLTKPVNSAELRARLKAGERILDMQQELRDKNAVIAEALTEMQRLHEAINSDLVEARKLQESLVPERDVRFGDMRLSLLLQSSGHVGGDLVGYYPAGEGHLGVFSIDVSGHGISSALMTARLAGHLSSGDPRQNIALVEEAGSIRHLPPAEVVSRLNDIVLEDMSTEHYFTILLADIDLNSGCVRIAQAGHPHPAVQEPAGLVRFFGGGGFPVGLIEGMAFDEFEIALSPGDRLLIHSDGITECETPGGDLLGEEGLVSILEDLHALEGTDLLAAIVGRLTRHAGTPAFTDDVSAVLVQFEPRC